MKTGGTKKKVKTAADVKQKRCRPAFPPQTCDISVLNIFRNQRWEKRCKLRIVKTNWVFMCFLTKTFKRRKPWTPWLQMCTKRKPQHRFCKKCWNLLSFNRFCDQGQEPSLIKSCPATILHILSTLLLRKALRVIWMHFFFAFCLRLVRANAHGKRTQGWRDIFTRSSQNAQIIL